VVRSSMAAVGLAVGFRVVAWTGSETLVEIIGAVGDGRVSLVRLNDSASGLVSMAPSVPPHPAALSTNPRMKLRRQRISLLVIALTPHTVWFAGLAGSPVESMRVGLKHRKASSDISAVQVGGRRRDTEVGVRRVALGAWRVGHWRGRCGLRPRGCY